MKEKNLSTETRIIYRWIMSPSQFTKRISRRPALCRTEKGHNATPQPEILFIGEKCHGFDYSTTTAVPLALTINILLLVP